MNYELIPSLFFLEQLDDLSPEVIDLIEEKILLIKANPFRFKRIKGYNLFLFRIRFKEIFKKAGLQIILISS